MRLKEGLAPSQTEIARDLARGLAPFVASSKTPVALTPQSSTTCEDRGRTFAVGLCSTSSFPGQPRLPIFRDGDRLVIRLLARPIQLHRHSIFAHLSLSMWSSVSVDDLEEREALRAQ